MCVRRMRVRCKKALWKSGQIVKSMRMESETGNTHRERENEREREPHKRFTN